VRARHERKKVEILFAHLKHILEMDSLRLHGMSGAIDQFTLAAAAQNLERLAKLTTQGPPAKRQLCLLQAEDLKLAH
jgi:hypothetical protein